MHLVSTLAGGVNGAANGTATLVSRGTTTPVTYYLDFEATQRSTGTVTLDANGGAVVYVNELADVKVFDVNGVLLREFVAGAEAPGVEVISRSFTGTSYLDGSSGTGKPTTLQSILDLWLTSAGSPDFKVTVNGAATLLSAAVAGLTGLFFNVKSYGAIGDGVADDGAAISAAITAAAATVGTGGIVFFPPGLYRTTTTPNVPAGVSLMGCGSSTRLLVDNAALASLILFSGADSGSRLVQGLWFGATNTNFTAPLVIVGAAAARVDFVGCNFGGDSFTKGQHLNVQATGQGSRITATRCTFNQAANAPILTQSGTGRIVCDDCDFVVNLVGAYTQQVVGITDGVTVNNCRFDATAVTSGPLTYIGFAPATWGGCVFTGNRFKGHSTVTVTALLNSLVAPIYDCVESGNFFGDSSGGGIVAYGYTTNGYSSLGSLASAPRAHMSREARFAYYPVNGNQTVDAKSYGVAVVIRSGVGAQTISATLGSVGDRFVLYFDNPTGGGLLPNFDTGVFELYNSVGSITVNAGQVAVMEFQWINVKSLGGRWTQMNTTTIY